MKKFTPFKKLSKRKQQEENKKRRGTWGEFNPVTRRSPNPNAYNRNKEKAHKEDDNHEDI